MSEDIEFDRQSVEIQSKSKTPPGLRFVMFGVALLVAGMMIYAAAKSSDIFGKKNEKNNSENNNKTAEKSNPGPAPISVPLKDNEVPLVTTICPNGARLPPGMRCPELKAVPAVSSDPNTGTDGNVPDARVPEKTTKELSGDGEKNQLTNRRLSGEVAVSAIGEKLDKTSVSATPLLPGSNSSFPTVLNAVQSNGSALEGQLAPSFTKGASASLGANPSLTLGKGTLPDCTLNTAIRTGQPGFVKCTISRPVYSIDGKVVLLEAGTVVEGEYTTGITVGQQSVFTLWTRARTPKNVLVELTSPGTDGLGRAGTPGYVDNKFFERFAGAIFFSLFEDASSALKSKSGDSSSGVNIYNNTSTTTKALVEELLTQGRTIKPELFKNQGEVIKIFIARDVDFSKVYELTVQENVYLRGNYGR